MREEKMATTSGRRKMSPPKEEVPGRRMKTSWILKKTIGRIVFMK